MEKNQNTETKTEINVQELTSSPDSSPQGGGEMPNPSEGLDTALPSGEAPSSQQGAEGNNSADNSENDLFGKPENYDYNELKLPDGMTFDKNMTDKFNEYASKLNLSNKGASDLMTMAIELVKNERANALNSFVQAQNQTREEYKRLLNSDKEIGGAKLKESLDTANIAYNTFFNDEELRGILASGGLNVHPKFIKALKSIGAQMKEDKIYQAGASSEEKQSREDILFPTMN